MAYICPYILQFNLLRNLSKKVFFRGSGIWFTRLCLSTRLPTSRCELKIWRISCEQQPISTLMHPRRKGVFGSFRCSQFGRMIGFHVHTSRWCMWESCYISHLVTMTKWEFCCISHLVTMTKWEFCETSQNEPDSPRVVWRVLWHISSGLFTPVWGLSLYTRSRWGDFHIWERVR